MTSEASSGLFYRWRGVLGSLVGLLLYYLARPWLHPWLVANPIHVWYFLGSLFLVFLGVLVFGIWRRVRRGELQL